MKYIEPFYFFLAFSFGMLYVYISTPEPEIIIKYPVPDEAENIIYKDYSDMCYKYVPKEVKCTWGSKDMKIQRGKDEVSYLSKLFS